MPDNDQELAQLRDGAQPVVETLVEIAELTADVGEFLGGDDVKAVMTKVSRVARSLGFAGALVGLVIDVAQAFDENHKSDTDLILDGIAAVGTKVDALQERVDELFAQQTRDLKVHAWVVEVSSDVTYVQRAIARMRAYDAALKRWQAGANASGSADLVPLSDELQRAKEELSQIDSESLLASLGAMSKAARGDSVFAAEGILQLLYPDQRKLTTIFFSTLFHLVMGTDAYALVLYLHRMEQVERSSSPGYAAKARTEAAIQRTRAQRECGDFVADVVATYEGLMHRYSTIYFGQKVALHLPLWGGGVKLTGGRNGDVYAKVKHIQPGEIWQIVSAEDTARTGEVQYNDGIVLYQPWKDKYLTGGRKGDVYTKVKHVQPGEIWQIRRVDNLQATGPVQENVNVVFFQPWRQIYLTGWDTLVYASVKHIMQGENWQVQKLDR